MTSPDDDPNDPSHPDHDLSESAPHDYDEGYARPWFARRWLLLAVAILLIIGLFLPFVR